MKHTHTHTNVHTHTHTHTHIHTLINSHTHIYVSLLKHSHSQNNLNNYKNDSNEQLRWHEDCANEKCQAPPCEHTGDNLPLTLSLLKSSPCPAGPPEISCNEATHRSHRFQSVNYSVWYTLYTTSAGIACWLEHQTHDRKVVSLNPSRSGGRIFFSRVNFVCWLLLGVRSTPLLPQWHVKDLGHSTKSAGDRLHLNTHTPLTQRSRSGLTMPLSRQSVGIYQETSLHATCQGTLSHSCLSSLGHYGLVRACRVELVCAGWSPFKKKRKGVQVGSKLFSILPLYSHAWKKPPPPAAYTQAVQCPFVWGLLSVIVTVIVTILTYDCI